MRPWNERRLVQTMADLAEQQRRTALARQGRREGVAAVAATAPEPAVTAQTAQTAVAVAENEAESAAAEAPAGEPESAVAVEELLQQYLRRLRRVERIVFPPIPAQPTVVDLLLQLHERQTRLAQYLENLEASFGDLRVTQLRQHNVVARRVTQLQGAVDAATARYQRRWEGFALHLQVLEGRLEASSAVLEGRLGALERRVPPPPPRPAVAANAVLEGRLGALERRMPPPPPRPAVAAEESNDEQQARELRWRQRLARPGTEDWPADWDPPPGFEDLLR